MTSYNKNRDIELMREALNEAKKALEKGNYPIGAILLIDGEIIDLAGNNIHTGKNWISHAENTLLIKHSEKIRDTLLPSILDKTKTKPKVELFTTLEPCLMCLGSAIIHRISRIVYACDDPHGGASQLETKKMKDWYKNIWPEIKSGVCKEEAINLMITYLNTQKENDWIKKLKKYYIRK